MFLAHFSLAKTLVLVGGVIPPAPAVPASIRISARMECVQGRSSRVKNEAALKIGSGALPSQIDGITALDL